ncbi:NADH-quinone oxidoreductase subunit C [Nonomuraea fuscirosea]|uniref:NADH-quinone oxidoreductase subunit C n=1 Tax=Nonomuraea fuscirosea TaxID=1291556 RepID=A0A2T0MSG5_9ACTN|nr:NADH-quinone oxidoreductase subunit C [Nonomuraea fuscirosea]PRX61408.1 NADH-quinone oxidoreductase subunit C [Nonomuraea fuscirosea]
MTATPPNGQNDPDATPHGQGDSTTTPTGRDNSDPAPTDTETAEAETAQGAVTARISAYFGDRVDISESYGDTTADVAPADWIALLTYARDDLGHAFFDWLTGVDEPPDAFLVVAHVYNPETGGRLLLRTRVPKDHPHLPTAVGVYRGANWHERETYEMFGVIFDDHPNLVPLLLPDGFEGHPLRKDFILAARVAKPWPGAKEPGESGHGSPSRRKTLPPGVPADWGPPDA